MDYSLTEEQEMFKKAVKDFTIQEIAPFAEEADLEGEFSWEAWKKLGFDRNSIVADPRFVDADNDDYRLLPDSPALKLGFRPIPIEKIGPYKSPDRASWPIVEAAGAREAGFDRADLNH